MVEKWFLYHTMVLAFHGLLGLCVQFQKKTSAAVPQRLKGQGGHRTADALMK